ncbi:hypothetical protein EBT25_16075 [bacterium]|jgi:hypothetical protein|nr:hypothetical protein [bacterium]
MISKKNLTVISLWDILDHIGFSDAEVEAIGDYGLSGVSFGDSAYTLIGNNYALHLIQDSIATYYDELNSEDPDHPSRNILPHLYTPEEIATIFWGVVGEDDYINLESH